MMQVRAIRLLTANIVLGAVSLSFFLGTPVGVAAASAASQPQEAPRGTFRLQAVAAPIISATLVQTIATSAWNPGSPDPSGVVYLPGPDRLEVTTRRSIRRPARATTVSISGRSHEAER